MDFLLFVSLFHQLVAGPIVRYSHINNEINNRTFSWSECSDGVTRFCIGLFKKICIANVAGEIGDDFLDLGKGQDTILGAWYGISMYSLQIYFDFSGYSDMAIGLGWMFVFHYHENFNYPYTSKSITDFWRRWHISLSSFFKDYVYIPLGGSKSNFVRNMCIVWLITGLWHGASWNFILWGVYFGIVLLIEKVVLKKILDKLPALFRHLYALFFILLGWGFFYFTESDKLLWFLKTISGYNGGAMYDIRLLNSVSGNIWWILVAVLLCLPVYGTVSQILEKRLNGTLHQTLNLVGTLLLFSMSVVMLVGSTYNPFIYFRF